MNLFAYLFVFVLLFASVNAVEYCSEDCFDGGKQVFSTHTLYGGDNAIMHKENVVASSVYEWQFGKIVDFSLEYDSTTRFLTYEIDGNILQVKVDSPEIFRYIVLQGQTSFYGHNTMKFTELSVDKQTIDDFIVEDGISGVKIEPKQKFFKLTGKVMMDGDGNTNKNMAGMNIYLLESKKSGGSKSFIASVPDDDGIDGEVDKLDLTVEEDLEQVPEFGVVAAGIALIGAVAIVILKRK